MEDWIVNYHSSSMPVALFFQLIIIYFCGLFSVSPIISIPNQLVGALRGSDVLIECSTEAFPKSINYWAKGTGMIMTNFKYETDVLESVYRIIMKLRIKDLTTSDYGHYRCIAKNYLGETEGSVELYGEFKIYATNVYLNVLR